MNLKKTQIARGIVAVRSEASPGELKGLVEDLGRAFATFRAENDAQLKAVKDGVADSLQEIKVSAINDHITQLQSSIDMINAQMAAHELGIGQPGLKNAEYTKAFASHMRRGDVQASMSEGSAPDGGYLAPVEWDRTITDKLALISPMRGLCQVQRISGAGFTKLFNMGGTASGWVGETDARPNTAASTLASLSFGVGEIYANPAATQTILDDAEINLETWLAGEVQGEFALQEDLAFMSGSGVAKPFGILTYVTGGANAAKHPFGAITALVGATVGAVGTDDVLDAIYDLPAAATAGAVLAVNRKSIKAIRKLKDTEGNYLWAPGLIAGQPSSFMGFPVRELPNMPDIATGAVAALFGDFKKTYLIIDRVGVRVLRDPYTNKPYISFYTTKRVGGGMVNPQYMRALKVK